MLRTSAVCPVNTTYNSPARLFATSSPNQEESSSTALSTHIRNNNNAYDEEARERVRAAYLDLA